MLILIAFGYWYTVIPVYQKSLLDEEISKKTLELNKATKDLGKLEAKLSVEEKKLALVQSTIDRYKSESSKSKSEAAKAKFESVVARESEATKYALLRNQSLSLFFGEILNYCTGEIVSSEQKLVECIISRSKQSSSFSRLDETDGNSVLVKLKKSVEANRDEWNTITVEYEKRNSALSQKIEDIKKANELSKKNRRRDTLQEKSDAIGADYTDEKILMELTFDAIKLKYNIPELKRTVIRKILNISI